MHHSISTFILKEFSGARILPLFLFTVDTDTNSLLMVPPKRDPFGPETPLVEWRKAIFDLIFFVHRVDYIFQ